MITIEFPNELPTGVDLRMISCDSEAEAIKEAGDKKCYLFKSKIIKAWYLFIPAESK